MKKMKGLKTKPYLILSFLMLVVGIFEILAHQISLATMFIALWAMFMTLNHTITEREQAIDEALIEADEVFLTLIREGQRKEAIKRCRKVTLCSLKDAVDYVDSKLS